MKILFVILLGLSFFLLLPPDYSAAVSLNDLYDVGPDVSQCDEGILKQTEKDKALNEVNRIRDLLNLPQVIYDSSFDNQTAQAALIIAANNDMSHYPPSTHACFSQDGADGSRSNLSMYWQSGSFSPPDFPESEAMIANWLIDSGVESSGHRRSILDPFLKQISYLFRG